MPSSVNIAVGLDLHKRFIIATILWSEGKKLLNDLTDVTGGIDLLI